MSKISTGITLFVIGAILAFALQVDIPGLGQHALGIILMLVGALLVGLSLVMERQRSRAHTVVEQRGPVVDERRPVVEDRAVVEETPVVEERRRRRVI